MLYAWSRETLLSTEPEKDLINKISRNSKTRDIHRWNNGRVGAIFPEADGHLLDFREYELYDGPNDNLGYPKGLRPVKEGDEDSTECKELLAVGIVAYYLNMRNKMNPKDIFAEYLEDAKKEFKILRDADIRAWHPGYKKDFPYSEHYKREQQKIRVSSSIFDYLDDAGVYEIRKVIVNYLRFVKSLITQYRTRDMTREEEKATFKKAVLRVMWAKNEQGDFIFNHNSQWIAIYCYAVDIYLLIDDTEFYNLINDEGVMETSVVPDTKQKKAFDLLTQELQLDQESIVRIPFKHDIDMSIETYKRYRSPHPWPKDGLKGKSLSLYNELEEIYTRFDKEFQDIEQETVGFLI